VLLPLLMGNGGSGDKLLVVVNSGYERMRIGKWDVGRGRGMDVRASQAEVSCSITRPDLRWRSVFTAHCDKGVAGLSTNNKIPITRA
jgi:hypothetical protein